MRLVCPNCSAQYEIDGSMIPDEGRDVQCSNCGHTWFELPPPSADFADMGPEDFGQSASAAEPDDASDDDDVVTAETSDDGAEPEIDDAEQNKIEEPSDDDGSQHDADDDEIDPSGAVAAAAAAAVAEEVSDRVTTEPTTLKARRPADAAALDILREEAERELSQRRAPPSETIETQTDLGLEEIRRRDTPSRALRARMAHLGEEDSSSSSDETRSSSEPETYEEPRRDLLPDIDEINSTLKPSGRPAESAQRGGFLTGFILMMLITATLIVAYARAPSIARAFPGAEGALITYVDRANAVRDWIDGLFNG